MSITRDLATPGPMYAKALLFLIIHLTSTLLIFVTTSPWTMLFAVAMITWSSARIYYFFFYVIEHYIDADHKFSSIYASLLYLYRKRR